MFVSLKHVLMLIYGIKQSRVLTGRGKSEQIKKGMNEFENSLTEAEHMTGIGKNYEKLTRFEKKNRWQKLIKGFWRLSLNFWWFLGFKFGFWRCSFNTNSLVVFYPILLWFTYASFIQANPVHVAPCPPKSAQVLPGSPPRNPQPFPSRFPEETPETPQNRRK